MKIGLVVKPSSDEARVAALRHGVRRLRANGHVVGVRVTQAPGHARRLARAAARAGCELVMAVGGDGTVNEVANGLARAGSHARVAVIPFGTANDFARGLSIPMDVDDALTVAVSGAARPLDLGCVNGRYFVNVSTGGFGARATTHTPRTLKRYFGPLAYLATGAQQLLQMKPQHATFVADGATVHDGPFVFFACGNSVLTGGGTRITPRASIRDAQLDVVVLPWVSRLEFLSLLPDLRRGSHIESPDVHYVRASRFEVHAAMPIPANADGEPLAARDLVYTVHPQPLEVMTPRR